MSDNSGLEKARQFLISRGWSPVHVGLVSGEKFLIEMAAYADFRVREVLEECCRVLCNRCLNGEPAIKSERYLWDHQQGSVLYQCQAALIRNRFEKEMKP